jgi:hypothetical protein
MVAVICGVCRDEKVKRTEICQSESECASREEKLTRVVGIEQAETGNEEVDSSQAAAASNRRAIN